MNRITRPFLTLLAGAVAAAGLLMAVPATASAQPATLTSPRAVSASILPAPSGLHAAPAVRKVTLTWNSANGAPVYELRVVPAGGGAVTRFDRVLPWQDRHGAVIQLSPGRYDASVRAGLSTSDVHGNWTTAVAFSVPAASAGGGSAGAALAIAFALSKIGCPYVYGGLGPCSAGYDCSGLVVRAWQAGGINFLARGMRTTYELWAGLAHVSRSSLQPGDLVFSNGFGHVMLYIGGGYVVQSPHTGAFVERTLLSYVGAVGYARA